MLYLIGVDHSVQSDGRTEYEGEAFETLRDFFPECLAEIAKTLRATVIAEELNEDVLTKFDATHSVACTVASELGIGHKFCDPGIAKREERGITRAKTTAENDAKREEIWLEELAPLRRKRIVFVCGAKHIKSFSARAKAADFDIETIIAYYGEAYFGQFHPVD